MTFISDKNPVPEEAVPSFDRFAISSATNPRVLKIEPGRLAYAPGIEIREVAIGLAVDWLKGDPAVDGHRLFLTADRIAEYIRTGEYPTKTQE